MYKTNQQQTISQSVDILELITLLIQLKNIEWDENHNNYIKQQLQQLHNQNQIIMKQNEEILKKIKYL